MRAVIGGQSPPHGQKAQVIQWQPWLASYPVGEPPYSAHSPYSFWSNENRKWKLYILTAIGASAIAIPCKIFPARWAQTNMSTRNESSGWLRILANHTLGSSFYQFLLQPGCLLQQSFINYQLLADQPVGVFFDQFCRLEFLVNLAATQPNHPQPIQHNWHELRPVAVKNYIG